MEPTAAVASAHTPQVIELAIEETVVYEFKWRIEIKYPLRPIGHRATPLLSHFRIPKPTHLAKAKPIARVLPAIRERKRSSSTENDSKWDTNEKILQPQSFGEVRSGPVYVYTFKTEKTAGLTPTEEQEHKNKEHISKTEVVTSTSQKEFEGLSQERPDPCASHRDWVRKAFLKSNPKQKETIRDMECVDGEGCHSENTEFETKSHSETSISDCLEEFLNSLHLSHLLDYLKVLGCMCVRDLRLLETPELEAIQLISRRRLLQQLDSVSFHHEDSSFAESCLSDASPILQRAPLFLTSISSSYCSHLPSPPTGLIPDSSGSPSAPPEGCSLEAWLTWYGLGHISGFLTSIGVHSVGDLKYLREDDLVLLKPVTRRRIIACNRKQ
ncbi:uncharacterized protein [Palaemon carinicauda]|uniref:uncharacterized protein isoform X2 n=1 Tax=Palaemon carinicauda TaxID=392227 RepID=UPI0035B64D3D